MSSDCLFQNLCFILMCQTVADMHEYQMFRSLFVGSCAFWSEGIFNDLADGYSEVGDEVSSRGWLDPERIETLHPACVVFMGLIVKDLSILYKG